MKEMFELHIPGHSNNFFNQKQKIFFFDAPIVRWQLKFMRAFYNPNPTNNKYIIIIYNGSGGVGGQQYSSLRYESTTHTKKYLSCSNVPASQLQMKTTKRNTEYIQLKYNIVLLRHIQNSNLHWNWRKK